MSRYNWEGLLIRDDAFGSFYECLTHVFNEAFPIQKIKLKSKKPWVSKGIKTSANNLRSLHYIRKYTNEQSFFDYYNKYRKIYRDIIRKAKDNHYKSRIEQSGNKTKESWTIINELRGKDQRRATISLNPNDINNYYCSIAGKLTESIIPPNDPLSYMNEIYNHNTLCLYNTNIVELKETIKAINNKKSAGLDEISVKIFENLPDSVLHVLASLINKSFESGIFPSFLKTSIVIPLHKGGSMEDPSNFRPVSLIPTLAKIIEKLVKKRVVEFLSSCNILSDHQFGFQRDKNTNDAIFSFLKTIYTEINGGEAAAAIFCDLSKAFDCVQHEILLRKLELYGFRGTTLNWFRSYLSDRSQIVKTSTYSNNLNINHGVPQGSVLGPTLFLLYINDLTEIDIKGKFTLFADDTTILWHNKDGNSLWDLICSDINKVKDWCDSNLLSFNISKTNIISFHCNLLDISLGNHVLEKKSCTKFLGLNIDYQLKFKEHVTSLSNKLASGCYAIRIISTELGYTAAKTAYFSLIDSHLRYGISFWGACSRHLIQMILVLQKRAVRYLCKAKVRDSCKPLFLAHGIPTVISIYILETACLIHKHRRNTNTTPSHYITRQSNNITLPIPRSTLVKDSIIYNGNKLYNHLPNNVKDINSNIDFRKAVKGLLIVKAYYDLSEYYNDTF